MISVICPYHNSTDFIANAINGLLSQKVQKGSFEVIFIDDGSTDNTTEIIKQNLIKFKEKNIDTKLIHQSQGGAGFARNTGIKNSKYDYIAFLDSDDKWRTHKLQRCIDIINQNRSNINLIIHDELFIRLNNSTKRIYNGKLSHSTVSESLYRRNSFSTSAIVVKKKILIEYNLFNEDLMSSQDYELWLRISPSLKVMRIDEILGEYYENPHGITSKYYGKRFLDQLLIAFKYRHYVSLPIFIYKVIKIIFNKQWLYGLSNIIVSNKGHNY